VKVAATSQTATFNPHMRMVRVPDLYFPMCSVSHSLGKTCNQFFLTFQIQYQPTTRIRMNFLEVEPVVGPGVDGQSEIHHDPPSRILLVRIQTSLTFEPRKCMRSSSVTALSDPSVNHWLVLSRLGFYRRAE